MLTVCDIEYVAPVKMAMNTVITLIPTTSSISDVPASPDSRRLNHATTPDIDAAHQFTVQMPTLATAMPLSVTVTVTG